MLHIAKKTGNYHKKSFATEVFIGLMLLSIFHVSVTQASDITAENVINMANKARTSANVGILNKSDLLQKAAQQKAQDMLDQDYFAHVSPEGKSPWFWLESVGYDYRYAGENLAINYTNTEAQQKAWMESPLHRKNILNADYQEIGVAVKEGVIDGQKTIITVQMFGTKVPQMNASVPVTVKQYTESYVAGIDSTQLKKDFPIVKNTDKIELSAIYQQNKPSFVGWLVVLGIAIMVIIVDVAALIHKKHSQLLILHDARNRNA